MDAQVSKRKGWKKKWIPKVKKKGTKKMQSQSKKASKCQMPNAVSRMPQPNTKSQIKRQTLTLKAKRQLQNANRQKKIPQPQTQMRICHCHTNTKERKTERKKERTWVVSPASARPTSPSHLSCGHDSRLPLTASSKSSNVGLFFGSTHSSASKNRRSCCDHKLVS